jgi:signal transduction histidine kinase
MKIGYAGVIYICVFNYHFIIEFLKIKKERIFVYISYLLATIFLCLHLGTNLFTDGVTKYFWGYYPHASTIHPIFLIFFMGLTSILNIHIFLYLFILKNKASSINFNQQQLKYVFLAYLLYTPACIDFLANYNIAFYPFGYVFSTSFLAIIAYAIVRHQLMDIEVIIKKTLVFAGLLASVFAILVLPTLLIQEYIFRGAHTGGRLLGLTLSGIIIILSLRRIEVFLMNITDKYLFQKKYNYKELLKTFTGEVLTVINLDKLVNLTVDKLADIVKINSCSVMLLDAEKQQFNVVASRSVKDTNIVLARPDGIVTFLEQTHGYLLKKELTEKKVYIPDNIQEIINRLNAELIIPMILNNEVMGILTLGKKKSDEEYTQDDLDILLPLVKTLAIAISNAKLFDELGKTQAEAAQKEKMAVIGTLSAGINHEICNPLGIARGQCEAFLLNLKDGLYKDKTPDELITKAKDIMAKVIKETDRATAITKKLSGFAKPAKGEAEMVNIDKEIDDVLGLVGYELKLEKIEFEKSIEKGLPDIFVDRKQLQEVLFNLIRNAGQAIGEKGRIAVSARQDEGKVLIDIKDTGSGIPEDKLKELFNPFFTTKEPGKGTGLGLFIVRQVVEKNGGRIYLKETRVGEGTTFTIEFPVKSRQGVKV